MPFPKKIKNSQKSVKEKLYYQTYCSYCNKSFSDHPTIILPCDHQAHMECTKKEILSRFYSTFWDFWGIYDFYCGCGEPLKHLCFCHTVNNNCKCCTHHREHKVNNVEEVERLNSKCINKKVKGFYYRGEETIGEGNIEFVC